ncbi:MAG: hypothetical protein K2P81_01030 [Bacteriovoracaceae bacterium]|nr:hypothetical protein [Bacteriovoracaceae bacterium]
MNQFNFPPHTHLLAQELLKHSRFKLQQIHEWAEWIGYETRNKYSLTDLVGNPVGFAAEQQKGLFGFVMRQFFGHWRRFNIDIFNTNRELALRLNHPFRWFFQRIEVLDAEGVMIGALQQKFSFFTKSFDVEDPRGKVRYQVRSPIWRIWTFSFTKHGHEVAEVKKRWSGLISEVFTDRDNFLLTMKGPNLDAEDRLLILAASIFVDLQYFERKAR